MARAGARNVQKATKDAFDVVIEEWARERPDLDVAPIGLIGRLRLAGLLVERFYEESIGPYDLRPADFFLLSELRRSGPPFVLSPGDLSQLLVRSTGGVTRQLDQLEERGWIQREPDPRDRRGVRVVLTDAGRELIDEALTGHFDNEARLLGGLAVGDQERLAGLLREVNAVLERETRTVPRRRKSTNTP